jgi:hypothetical protein
MGGIEEELGVETVLDHMKVMKNEEEATFHMSTGILAKPGETISGDKIAEIVKKSQLTGIPVAKLVREIEGATVQTWISPGEGVPDSAKRKPSRKRSKS